MRNKNRYIGLVLVFLMVLCLCACGKETDIGSTTTSQIHAEEPVVDGPQEKPEDPAPELTDPVKIAEDMLGQPVSDLLEKIGEPNYTDYAPSCLGPGEDGELGYDGFTVYTYREGDTECIEEVARTK